jgi:gliding motility-associated-like protein
VEGDVLITNTGVINNFGTLFVQNDWINNSVFNVFLNSNPGTVNLFGTNQSITGTNPTKFYNLVSQNAAVKSMFLDVWVENKLDITDSEITLNNNTLHLYNTHPDSLIWSTGFISGDTIGGYFLRSTDRTAEYLFPVGSNALLNNHRAVSFTPNNSDSSVIGVRLAAIDVNFDFTGTSITGSTGPFPLAHKDPKVLRLNKEFYHHIARFFGTTNGKTKIYYFDSDEPSFHDFNGLAFWNNSIPRWSIPNYNSLASALLPSIGSPDKVFEMNSLDFSNDVYALSIEDQITVYVPQIFSPNGDGLNDILYVHGNRVEYMTFIVYNRWGEKVFESNDNSVGWDGQFRGADAQGGVYVYYLEAKIIEGEVVTRKGDITLVR